MPKLPVIPLVMALIGTAGCQPAGQSSPPAGETQHAGAGSALPGKAAYERACGRCHDRGLDGAPVTGDRAAWAGRSPLWEAVLYEHATNGYLDMPAMGDSPELDKREVEAAAEYMLSVTHPELTPDPQ